MYARTNACNGLHYFHRTRLAHRWRVNKVYLYVHFVVYFDRRRFYVAATCQLGFTRGRRAKHGRSQ